MLKADHVQVVNPIEQDLQRQVDTTFTLYVVQKAKRGNVKTRIRLQRVVIWKLDIVNGTKQSNKT